MSVVTNQATVNQAQAIIVATPAEQLTTAQLVAEYNRLSGKAAIKAFHTRAKGISAVNALRAPATTGTGNAAAKRASRKPSPAIIIHAGAPATVPAQAPANPGAGAMGALAATLNAADAEQAAIDALAKARKSAKATKTTPAKADAMFTEDADTVGAATMPPRLALFVGKVGKAYPKGFTKAQAIAAATTNEPSGAEHHQRGNFNWAVRLGLFKAA